MSLLFVYVRDHRVIYSIYIYYILLSYIIIILLYILYIAYYSPVWARGRCRISPPRFLAEYCKRQLNQAVFCFVVFVLLYFRLSTYSDLYWVCFSVFSCTILFVSTSQVIGCEDRLRNDLYCVEWGVKLYSNQPTIYIIFSSISTLVTLVWRDSTAKHFQFRRWIRVKATFANPEIEYAIRVFLPRDAMHPRYYPWACVCVCLSQVGVLLKRLNESGWFLACELPSTRPTLC